MPAETTQEHEVGMKPAACPLPKWGRRLGAVAILFFFAKGMAWLTVPALLAWWAAK